jgi:MscS family membrane protein
MSLYETLNRIQLPPFDQIPEAEQWASATGTNVTRWIIPNTEIALARVTSGPRQGEFLFSSDTVARADGFYKRVGVLGYIRAVPLENLREIITSGGGWPIPYRWIQAMPTWMRAPFAGQAAWKWIALALILGLFALFLRAASRLSRRCSPDHPFQQAVAQLVLPLFVLVAAPAVAYVALAQINLIGNIARLVALVATAIMYLAGAWICWRTAPVIAEAIIASPRIAPQSIDAHLIRITTRLLGIAGAAALLTVGAGRLGIPVYGIVAGLGVGGLAIALAAQSTVENLIGGLNLFADKPVRVGDLCKYGEAIGTVEGVGIRSTRIRGIDRTLTTIPNAVLAKMPIVNFAVRDRMLVKMTIGLRYETQPEQLRYVLAKLRELLLAHPKVTPEPARVRFIGFGECSLNLEVFAYVDTRDWNEFLAIQEDIHLRIMEVVAASGTGFAFPSQTLYFARDSGLHSDKAAAALAQVQQWRAEQKLPFPDFDLAFRQTHRDTLEYPPAGSATAGPKPQV